MTKGFVIQNSKRLLVVLLTLILTLTLAACGGNRGNLEDEFEWGDIALSDMLPEPKSNIGHIFDNSGDSLWMDVNKTSMNDYQDYLDACQAAGFIIESDESGNDYSAFNEAGYKLSLSYSDYSEELSIEIEAPIELGTLKWPASEMVSKLPVPKSSVGNIESESSTFFNVYVGKTSVEDYNAYVDECMEKGFSLDYSRGDTDYFADNAEGYHLSVSHEGNEVMSIVVQKLEDTSDIGDVPVSESEEATSASAPPSSPTTTTPTSAASPSSSDGTTGLVNGMRPEFKAAMDSYEAFYDEYNNFMKEYMENPTDLALLAEYTEMLNKLAEMEETFEAWDEDEMNDAELAYYLEVSVRIAQKLLEAAQ